MNILKQSSFTLFLAGLMALLLSACSEDVQRGLQPVPTAFGKINQIEILIDEELWEGPVGDTLRFYYSGAYPILPQPEPIFDLRPITPHQLEMDPIKKELRNYMIIANLSDMDSPTSELVRRDLGEERVRKAKEDPSFNSSVGRDKWALGQLLIYQFGGSEDALIENLKKNFPAIKKRFQDGDRDRIDATVFFNGESGSLKTEIKEKMDANIRSSMRWPARRRGPHRARAPRPVWDVHRHGRQVIPWGSRTSTPQGSFLGRPDGEIRFPHQQQRRCEWGRPPPCRLLCCGVWVAVHGTACMALAGSVERLPSIQDGLRSSEGARSHVGGLQPCAA